MHMGAIASGFSRHIHHADQSAMVRTSVLELILCYWHTQKNIRRRAFSPSEIVDLKDAHHPNTEST